jgi:4-amino-4-deoxy-L-arabinose transferase-like glycosyltransferase
MKRFTGSDWAFLILLALLTAFYVRGLPVVPFHPDESTQLYMSADFEQLLTNPLELAFNPNVQDNMEQHYRLIDAPLTRYLLGFGRAIGGLQPLTADWDWSKTWDENMQAGALPGEELLYAGRLAITLLLPLGLVFLYLTGRQVGDGITGLSAGFFLGLNALVLLHGRRAMAEGLLIFGVAFLLWSLFQSDKRPWLTGLAMAIAFNAKQSTLALLPVGLIAHPWLSGQASIDFKRIGANIAQYLGVFILLTFALNPVFWNSPVQTIQIAIHERQDLLERQVADIQRLAPEKVLDSPGERLVAILANLYATPPMFYEVGNYIEETQSAEVEYLKNPGHDLFRGLAGGGIMLFITLFGVATSLFKLRSPNGNKRRAITLLSLASAAQFSALLLAVPLPWQRYIIPLVPFMALWAGIGLADLISAAKTALPAPQKKGGQ